MRFAWSEAFHIFTSERRGIRWFQLFSSPYFARPSFLHRKIPISILFSLGERSTNVTRRSLNRTSITVRHESRENVIDIYFVSTVITDVRVRIYVVTCEREQNFCMARIMRSENGYLRIEAHQIESSAITCRKVFPMIYLVDEPARAVTSRGWLALCELVYDFELSRGFRYLLPRVHHDHLYAHFTKQLL